jgi:hypothetical protein
LGLLLNNLGLFPLVREVIPTYFGKIPKKKIWDYSYTSWDYSLKNVGIIPNCGGVIPTCVEKTTKKKKLG